MRRTPGSRRPAASTASPTPPSSGTLPENDPWSLPGTVLAMVEARLERLDPMARRVLRAASLFGEVFWRGGLLALTGGDYSASEVDDWLAELSRREIVQRRDVSRFPSEHEYQFRHALVRDAGLPDAHRGGSCARPQARRRLAGRGGRARGHGARRALRARRRARQSCDLLRTRSFAGARRQRLHGRSHARGSRDPRWRNGRRARSSAAAPRRGLTLGR